MRLPVGLSDMYSFLRFAYGLKSFLRELISLETARAHVRQGMQVRDVAFLQNVERTIFANPTSPYLKLFQAARCELGDLKSLVSQEGVEGALQQLLQAGVYVTFEEFKGKTAAVRGSQTFSFRDTDFDNPRLSTHLRIASGGTRGRPTQSRIDLDYIAQTAPHWALWFAAHDWLANPLVFWEPKHTGMAARQLRCIKFGKKFVKWFATARMGTVKERLISASVHTLVRRSVGLPKPEFVPLNEAWKVGEYLVGMVQDGNNPCVNTSPTAAVRISLDMQERGKSLQNVTFLLGSEPLTPTRKDTIEASGAKAVPTYGSSESAAIGSQCPNPTAADDIHVSLDIYEVIQRAQPLYDGQTADALLLTSLLPACPKVLLNAEIGDYAVVERRHCGCLFDELGYVKHLHTIRSSQKLTGEGVTIVGADLYHLIEEVLPKRFGGTLADYQLVEEQDARGLPQYALIVSPEVGMLNENALAETFLEELGKMKSSYRLMVDLWVQADSLRVKRRRPLATGRGKILPFRTLGSQ